jgi:hypothetical protein
MKMLIFTLWEKFYKTLEDYEIKLGKWVADTVYSEEHKSMRIAEIDNEFKAAVYEADDKFEAIVRAEIGGIKGTSNMSSDYQQKLQTALLFLNNLDNVSDMVAYDLIQPLFGDYMMQRKLFAVIHAKTDNPMDSLTCKLLNGFDDLISELEEILRIYKLPFRSAFDFNGASSFGVNAKAESVINSGTWYSLKNSELLILGKIELFEQSSENLAKAYAMTPDEAIQKYNWEVPKW